MSLSCMRCLQFELHLDIVQVGGALIIGAERVFIHCGLAFCVELLHMLLVANLIVPPLFRPVEALPT